MSQNLSKRPGARMLAAVVTLFLLLFVIVVLRPGYRMLASRGGFDEIPAVGFRTYQVCFRDHVSLVFIDSNGTLGTIHAALAYVFNAGSRKIAEIRSASRCPAGVGVDWVEDQLRAVIKNTEIYGLRSFAFVHRVGEAPVILELQFADQFSPKAVSQICSILSDHGFPSHFPVQASGRDDGGRETTRSVQCR